MPLPHNFGQPDLSCKQLRHHTIWNGWVRQAYPSNLNQAAHDRMHARILFSCNLLYCTWHILQKTRVARKIGKAQRCCALRASPPFQCSVLVLPLWDILPENAQTSRQWCRNLLPNTTTCCLAVTIPSELHKQQNGLPEVRPEKLTPTAFQPLTNTS